MLVGFCSTFITQMPHHGNPVASLNGSSAQAASTGVRFENNKHVMLSYQWDCQSEVQKVREHFAKLGIPTWMDIDGGMQGDVYDSSHSWKQIYHDTSLFDPVSRLIQSVYISESRYGSGSVE